MIPCLAVLVHALLLGAPGGRTTVPQPEWHWRPILMPPRPGGKLRTVTVDPDDPRIIYVGSEEGILLRTEDGGATWEELQLQPFVIYQRSLGLHTPGLPELGETTESNFFTSADPPGLDLVDRFELESVVDPFEVRPSFFYASFLVRELELDETLLEDATASREEATTPINRVAICKGARYPLLVATFDDLLGSDDNGRTFVRLFANPGTLEIKTVTCVPQRPNLIVVGTEVGLFLSKDGGLAFTQDLDAWPGQEAGAVAIAIEDGGKKSCIYSASESELYGGDWESGEVIDYLYPGDDSSTAPWLNINSISATADGHLWLATDDGVRRSLDGGETFENVSPDLLGRQAVNGLVIGESESGGRRVVVMINHTPASIDGVAASGLHDSVLYASDDDGEHWSPFFAGLSQRTFKQLTNVRSTDNHPAGWWLVTSGELWTNYPAEIDDVVNEKAKAWADRRLAKTPPLGQMLGDILDHLHLDAARVLALANRHRALNWVPRIDFRLELSRNEGAGLESQTFPRFDGSAGPLFVQNIQGSTRDESLSAFVQLYWELNDTLIFTEENSPTREQLHELRSQIAHAAEDSWRERRLQLNRLSRGMGDPYEIEIAKSRVLTLEAMLAVWLGESPFEP